MEDVLVEARKVSRDAKDCLRTLDALREMGFEDETFPSLHHQRGSICQFYSYCGSIGQFRDDNNNHRVSQRLMYVLLSCPDGTLPKGVDFGTLAAEAYRFIPPAT